MVIGFYSKLAWNGIKKNKQFYIPYIVTCIVMVCMTYIINSITLSETIKQIRGGELVIQTFGFGILVVNIFSLIVLLYTNSFLMRSRHREFGLFNILGMNKKNICRIIINEMLMCFVFSFVVGIICGISLSKLVELILVNIINGDVTLRIEVPVRSIADTFISFIVIYVILFIINTIRIRVVNPVELLKSSSVGEKPPKANWFLGIVGLGILGWAYYMAMTVENPAKALMLFFGAVVMVIVATYLLFIVGSVTICKLLQKNKKYYYKPNHFVSVASMVYRMKRNGAGLASICILSTMVLVTMSTTSSMYFNAEDAIKGRCLRDYYATIYFDNYEKYDDSMVTGICEKINEAVKSHGIEPDDSRLRKYGISMGNINDNVCSPLDNNTFALESANQETMAMIYVFDVNDYNNMVGADESLRDDEILMGPAENSPEYEYDTLEIAGKITYKVKGTVRKDIPDSDSMSDICNTYYMVTNDINRLMGQLFSVKNASGMSVSSLTCTYEFNASCDKEISFEEHQDILDEIKAVVNNEASVNNLQNDTSYYISGIDTERAEFYGMYGGLLCLGIMVSIVFVFATVLIIYFKQVSEGYEDQHRFVIMRKVGMNKKEIRKCINSQLLTVFFLPIIMAAVHLVFAFPMLRKILGMMMMTKMSTLIISTVITVGLFALGYSIVYWVTSKVYYGIVSR